MVDASAFRAFARLQYGYYGHWNVTAAMLTMLTMQEMFDLVENAAAIVADRYTEESIEEHLLKLLNMDLAKKAKRRKRR